MTAGGAGVPPAGAGLPCRMVLTGPEDSTTTAASVDDLVVMAAGGAGSTVAVGATPVVADAFLAHVVGFDTGPRPGLAVRAGTTTVVDVGTDGRV